MTRVAVYSIALVIIIGATALNVSSILLPTWTVFLAPLPPSSTTTLPLRITYGLHSACSSVSSKCRPFPRPSDCAPTTSSLSSHFCTLWRSASFLISLSLILQLVTLLAFLVILFGNNGPATSKRKHGWKILVALGTAVVLAQMAATMLIAYLYDYDERFFVGWRLGTGWILAVVSCVLGAAATAWIGVARWVLGEEGLDRGVGVDGREETVGEEEGMLAGREGERGYGTARRG